MNRIPLEPEALYHIYNHSVGDENIFREEDNYLFFLRNFALRIVPFTDIFAYCLMPNHFHFVLRVKSKNDLLNLWRDKIDVKLNKRKIKLLPDLNEVELFDEIITTQFANFFNSYVQSYNKKYSRIGSLLKESFQRKRIDSEEYLVKVICYVHNNPVSHGFAKKESWKYSSYNAILSPGKTKVLKEEILELFGDKENFIFMHQMNPGNEIENS